MLALGLAAHGRDPGLAPSTGEWVRPHVRCDRDDVADLLDHLLARAVRVDGLDAALDAADGGPDVVVTAAGDRFSAHGWRLGAGADGVTAAALDEARAGLAAAERDLARCVDVEATAVADVAHAHRHQAEVAGRLEANDATMTSASQALAVVIGDRRELQAEAEAADRRIAELDDHLGVERTRIAELDGLVPSLEAGEAAEADAVRTRRRRPPGPRRPRGGARVRDGVTSTSVPPGSPNAAPCSPRRLDEVEGRLAADLDARASVAARRQQVERTLDALVRLASLVERRWVALDAHHGDLVQRRRRQSDDVKALAASLDGLRRRRSEAEAELDGVRERARRADLDETEARLRLETAVDTLRRDLDVEPDSAEAAPPPALPEGVSAVARVRELEREVRLLGPINPLALEEFTELQQRHTFLEEQLDDVRTTRRELTRVIKAVDHEIMSVFAGAFADVASTSPPCSSGLFPGGAGRLVLTEPDDLLATGIEVEAQPGREERQEAVAAVGRRAQPHRARVPVRGVPQPPVAVLRDGRGRGRARRRQPPPLPRPGRRVPPRGAAARRQPPEADDGGRRLAARRDDAARRVVEGASSSGSSGSAALDRVGATV